MFMKKIHRTFAVLALALAALVPQLVSAQSLSDYVENKVVDLLLRGQAFTAPTTIYVGLSTAACSDSSVGTEVTGGSYARASVTASLANWAGTQSAGSTTASSGTGGQTSNNAAINFATPSAGWGTVTHWFLIDASSGGNLLVCAALTTSKTINSGDSVSFAIGALTLTVQ
ncbi:phage tail fiber protein [Methylibium petroleiphilum]